MAAVNPVSGAGGGQRTQPIALYLLLLFALALLLGVVFDARSIRVGGDVNVIEDVDDVAFLIIGRKG